MKHKICFVLILSLLAIKLIPSKQYVIHAQIVHPHLVAALVPICSAESSYEGTKFGAPRQFEADGHTVRYGRVNHHDRGECQINEVIHRGEIEKLGVDIETLDGNIAFANWLYQREGSAPWNWSKEIWR